jgi:hypothetical protein
MIWVDTHNSKISSHFHLGTTAAGDNISYEQKVGRIKTHLTINKCAICNIINIKAITFAPQ